MRKAFYRLTILSKITLLLVIIVILNGYEIKAQSGRPSGELTVGEQLRVNLYAEEIDGSTALYDGTLSLFKETYMNEINLLEDAPKLNNFYENLAIYNKNVNKYLVIEKRKPIFTTDTISFRMYGMRAKTYGLEFVADKMNHPNVVAYLEDVHLNTKTQISLNGITYYRFTIDNNAGTKNPDRFRILFIGMEEGPVPVTFTSVKARQQNDRVEVQWQVANQVNIKSYEVETSVDGTNFVKEGSIPVEILNDGIAEYKWTDISPVKGGNFYRIRSIDQDGRVQYTQILKVDMGTSVKKMQIYPNPVQNGAIVLQMNNMPAGVYSVRITNMAGQLQGEKIITHMEGNSTEVIQMARSATRGVYSLQITLPDGTKAAFKLYNQ